MGQITENSIEHNIITGDATFFKEVTVEGISFNSMQC